MKPRKTNSTNSQNRTYLHGDCLLAQAMEAISGRWALQVLYSVHFGDTRFGEIKKRLVGISDKMLGQRLVELVGQGCLSKKGDAKGQSYFLTTEARDLIVITDQLVEWKKSR